MKKQNGQPLIAFLILLLTFPVFLAAFILAVLYATAYCGFKWGENYMDWVLGVSE